MAKAAPTKSKMTNYADIKPGDLMAIVTFVRVDSKTPASSSPTRNPLLGVTDIATGMTFDVEGTEIAEGMFSADRYVKEEKKNKTELAEILQSSSNVPFTVVFEKLDGSERTLRGRLVSVEPLMGRTNVIDLDIKSGMPLRQVDHRTIKSIIVGGVKYSLKK